MNAIRSISAERWALAFGLIAFFSLIAAVGFSTVLGNTMTTVLALVVLAVLTPITAMKLPEHFDGAFNRNRLMSLLWLILMVVAVARFAGVALYMVDEQQPQASAIWFDGFYQNHSCLSAYWKAAEVSLSSDDNIYLPDHYAGHVGHFKIDEYLYPPQFLLLPQVATAMGADFLQTRALWFVLDAGIIALTIWLMCLWLGRDLGQKVALLSPLIWLATPTLITLQTGNFQLIAIAMTVLAMVLFERNKIISGGALMGFALFKIFPAVLCGYLLFAGRWKALLASTIWAVAYTVVAFAIMGDKPFIDFISYELPRITSGEQWAWLNIDGLQGVVAINHSVPGLVLKLKVLGFEAMDMAVMSKVAWAWSLVVIVMTIIAARKHQMMTNLQRSQVWLVLLSLAALRSPFVPDDYALFPVLWLFVLVMANMQMNPMRTIFAAVLWLAISLVLPWAMFEPAEAPMLIAISTFSQLLAIGFCIHVYVKNCFTQNQESAQAGTATSDTALAY